MQGYQMIENKLDLAYQMMTLYIKHKLNIRNQFCLKITKHLRGLHFLKKAGLIFIVSYYKLREITDQDRLSVVSNDNRLINLQGDGRF